jgi:hypothetical protein
MLAFAAAMLFGCAPAEKDGGGSVFRLTLPPNISIPNPDDLRQKIERSIGQPPRTKTYVLEGGRRIEVKPTPPDMSAAVRAFDAEKQEAHVEIAYYSDYKMPIVQIWRFDGKGWTDSIDPGIFAGRGLGPKR